MIKMSEKIHRLRLSTLFDQDIVSFLEVVPPSRRSELLRHVIRYYTSQLKDDGELFILAEQETEKEVLFPEVKLDKEEKEYKIRLDPEIDSSIIDIINKVPRKRRSEFWRHVLRYYISQLNDSQEVFIMPTILQKQTSSKQQPPIIEKPKRKKPSQRLKGLSF